MKSCDSPILRAENLTFRYKQFRLGPISIHVPQSSRVSVIGNNGSGKTTLLNLLSRLKRPYEGSLQINAPKARTALLGDHIHFPNHWKLAECVKAYLAMKNVHAKVDVDPIWHKTTFAQASKGMKMQILLKAIATLKPELLICDEPSSGLDPQHQQMLLHFLENFQGTLIMSTHYFSEMQKLDWTQTWLIRTGSLEAITPPTSSDEWNKAFQLLS
jgi:ABC-2 type transport system ATP-binding protein